MSNLILLKPHESKTYAVPFSWDRYVTYFDNEYYLDEKPNYLDLVIILLKEELYTRLHPKTKLKSKPINHH
jgi:hypothetical protein